jgi:RNA polymerase sigma-70 factor (ECF subfamily)
MHKPATLGRDGRPPDADRRTDDATLIARSRAEPEAFAAIFDRHATDIHRYAARRLGAGPAEDVVGETFLVAFRRLYRALARVGVDPAVESPADEVVARVAATGQRRALAAALARLKAADRDTLLLVDWAELTYDQAALALDVPVGTVRSRLNRARRKIREALDDINSLPAEEHHHD